MGGFQAALDNSFYELCTFHFKDEEAEAQKYKWFGKRGILPWALAIQATCFCHRLGSRAHLDLSPTASNLTP